MTGHCPTYHEACECLAMSARQLALVETASSQAFTRFHLGWSKYTRHLVNSCMSRSKVHEQENVESMLLSRTRTYEV